MARITARNVTFCATERSCTAAPPTISAPIARKLGTRNIDLAVMIFRANIVRMYRNALVTSDALVAIAAPATPIDLTKPAPKIKSGSSRRFTSCDASVIFIGVFTSSVPLNAAKPTVEMIAGTNVAARQAMYGPASTAVGEPATTPTTPSALAWNAVRSAIQKRPTREATKTASPTARWTSSSSPDAAALATTGAMMEGTKEMIQNAD